MGAIHTVDELFESHHKQLALRWIEGREGGGRAIQAEHEGAEEERAELVGYMNLSHPNRIQVLGITELDYLAALDEKARLAAIADLCGSASVAVVVTDGESPPAELLQCAARAGQALFTTPLPGHKIVRDLDYHLSGMLAEKEVLHGVFIEVMGIGVLLTGESGIGKSELALELISRGHRLIADDAPEFLRLAPNTINGICPPLLEGFLEVRGLGVINIRAMFGDRAIKLNKYLRLIIHLQRMDDEQYRNVDRLLGYRETRTILHEQVPQVTLPVAPGRNLAVLVESAALNHIQVMKGYDAAKDFSARMRRYMNQPQGQKQ